MNVEDSLLADAHGWQEGQKNAKGQVHCRVAVEQIKDRHPLGADLGAVVVAGKALQRGLIVFVGGLGNGQYILVQGD